MAAWRRKERANATAQDCYVLAAAGNGSKRIPKGYVPMALACDGGDGGEERVLVHVTMLKEPRMVALLEMAAQQFGHGQQGVLKIPCNRQQFQQIVSAKCSAT